MDEVAFFFVDFGHGLRTDHIAEKPVGPGNDQNGKGRLQQAMSLHHISQKRLGNNREAINP